MKRWNELKGGILLTYITMGTSSIISFLYTPIMLRLLGKSEYGVYNVSASVISYLGLLSFGFGSSYIRFYSRFKVKEEKENISRLNGMYLVVFLLISLISLISGLLLTMNARLLFSGGLTPEEIKLSQKLMVFMVLNLSITFPASVFSAIVTAHEHYVFQRIIELFRTILNPFLTLPLLLMGYKSIALVIISTLLTLGSLGVNIWYCLKKLKVSFSFHHFNFSLLKEIWGFSFYIFLNMIIDQINWSVDKNILGKIKGSGDAAVYSVGSQFNAMYLSFSSAISNVFIPRVNRMVVEKKEDSVLTNLFVKVGRIQFIVLSFLLGGFIFFGEYFVKIWAGRDYRETYQISYQIALWLMIPVTIPLIQNVGIEIQRAKNKNKFRSILYFFIALGNILISIPLCYLYGGIGCAMGTGIALIIGNGLLMNWYYHKHIHINILYFWKNILKFIPALALPCVSGVIIMVLIKVDSIVKLAGLSVIYAIIFILSMWKFGVTQAEKNLIKIHRK